MKVLRLKYICKSCGKEAKKLKDGHCLECIKYFKDQWKVSGYNDE